MHRMIRTRDDDPDGSYLHAEEFFRLFETKVLDNIQVVELLQSLLLGFKSLDDANLPYVVLVADSLRHLDLLHSHHLSRGDIESEENATVGTLANQLSLHPLDRRWKGGQVVKIQ